MLSTEFLTSKVVKMLVAIVIVALVMIPIIDMTTKTVVDIEEINEGSSGIDLALYTLADDTADKTVTVTLSDGNVVFSGDYTKTIPAVDMVVCISDTTSLFVRNGSLIFFDGTTNQTVTTKDITVSGTTVNDQTASWVYFPTANGKYSSYNSGFEYSLSDTVAVGTLAGVTAISLEDTVTTANLSGLHAHVQETETGVSGVIYDGTAPATQDGE